MNAPLAILFDKTVCNNGELEARTNILSEFVYPDKKASEQILKQLFNNKYTFYYILISRKMVFLVFRDLM